MAFPALDIQHLTVASRPDGGVVVAGVQSVHAFAAATDADGNLLWQYARPATGNDADGHAYPESGFLGVVQMDDGNSLLCGFRTNVDRQTSSLITILDAKGRVVEERTDVPEGNPLYAQATLSGCLRWGDGFALVGRTSDGRRGVSWVMKLEREGKKQWDRVIIPIIPEGQVIPLADDSLIFSAVDGDTLTTKLTKLNKNGEVGATRTIKGGGSLLLRSVGVSHRVRVIIYATAGHGMLFTLDEQLQDAQPPTPMGPFDASKGLGYVMPNLSLALFGRNSNAAVALFSDGHLKARVTLDERYESLTVDDAAPLTATEFVAVRGSTSVDPNYHGLVITWLKMTQ